ncbi:MAG: histidine--tRNA ligase [Eubacteriales bacterium]|nr:histidine--tRNA ligase [Eubacteriales bacterium]MDY3332815.1 histidine--tRNA ligase [Gallibacter sp.]
MLTKAPKGTKDILPKEAYKWQYIESVFDDVCRRYGFNEIRTPDFEHTELFVRGVGDTTDIVQKEMYTWRQFDKSLTLRPEGTSPVMRAFIENKLYALPQPSKIYYDMSCFRYEKPQAGRLRQFHQFGAEIFGSDEMMADFEIIALANDFLNKIGIKNISLEINSVGCPKCRAVHREKLKAFLADKYDELCHTCQSRFHRNPMRIIDCKSEICQELVKDAPRMLDYLCEDCHEAFENLKFNLDSAEIEYTVNPNIVRGLDYYTKTAFEFVTDTIGAQGTVCGGGRYDNLAEELGGPHIPGVGFGMGKERLLLLMEMNGIEIKEPKGVDVFVAFMGDEAKREAIKLVRNLRNKGIVAEIDAMERNFKGQFKLADRLGARKTIIIGEQEVEQRLVAIKDMATSEQKTVALDIDSIVQACEF